jgi:hypothetical protein
MESGKVYLIFPNWKSFKLINRGQEEWLSKRLTFNNVGLKIHPKTYEIESLIEKHTKNNVYLQIICAYGTYITTMFIEPKSMF